MLLPPGFGGVTRPPFGGALRIPFPKHGFGLATTVGRAYEGCVRVAGVHRALLYGELQPLELFQALLVLRLAGLGHVQLLVEALAAHKLVVSALLDQLSVVQDQDEVGVADRGEAVRDHERGAPDHQAFPAVQDDGLRPRVDGRRRLVQDADRGVFQKGPRDADALAFAAGELGPALAEYGLVLVRQAHDEVVGVGVSRRPDDVIHARPEPPVEDVFGYGAREQQRFLQHDADLPAQRRERQLAKVDAVEQDAASRRVVESGKGAYEGGLAGTGRADKGDTLSRPRLERDVLECVDATLIAEVDPFERDLPAGSLDVDRVRRVLDLDLGVPQRQGA